MKIEKLDKYKILIVDDEKDFAEMLNRFLKNNGYKSCYLIDSTLALDVIKEEKIQIAVLDICMPKESGITLLKKIKEYDKVIQCLIMTGYNSNLSFKSSLKTDADDYLMKPFDFPEIDGILKYFINKLERWESVKKDFIV